VSHVEWSIISEGVNYTTVLVTAVNLKVTVNDSVKSFLAEAHINNSGSFITKVKVNLSVTSRTKLFCQLIVLFSLNKSVFNFQTPRLKGRHVLALLANITLSHQ